MSELKMTMSQKRGQMVEEQIRRRGVHHPRLLAAMRKVPRELFVLDEFRDHAYEDTPLPIPAGQTISQPFVVALMIKMLKVAANDRVLEIGTGSGYAAAVLSCMVGEVYTVERHEALIDYARQRFKELGYQNIRVQHGDGTLGWPEYAPYDAIIVAAGGPEIPLSLRQQLAIGGRLVIPVGTHIKQQRLVRVTRESEAIFKEEKLGHVRFVPLIGEEGWQKQE